MAKFSLDIEDSNEPDFLLFGISSHAKIYRLCWSLNQTMNLKLINSNSPIELIEGRKKIKNSFELYTYYDEEMRISYNIIPNKAEQGFLLPEFKHVDYLFLLKENIDVDTNEIITQIRSSDQVLTAFTIQTQELKSLENLVF